MIIADELTISAERFGELLTDLQVFQDAVERLITAAKTVFKERLVDDDSDVVTELLAAIAAFELEKCES